MKTKIFTLVALATIAFSTQNANATIRRVGYTGIAVYAVIVNNGKQTKVVKLVVE